MLPQQIKLGEFNQSLMFYSVKNPGYTSEAFKGFTLLVYDHRPNKSASSLIFI